jgi:hypothetical protein
MKTTLVKMMAFRLSVTDVQLVKLAAQLEGRPPRSWMREVLVAAARRRIGAP